MSAITGPVGDLDEFIVEGERPDPWSWVNFFSTSDPDWWRSLPAANPPPEAFAPPMIVLPEVIVSPPVITKVPVITKILNPLGSLGSVLTMIWDKPSDYGLPWPGEEPVAPPAAPPPAPPSMLSDDTPMPPNWNDLSQGYRPPLKDPIEYWDTFSRWGRRIYDFWDALTRTSADPALIELPLLDEFVVSPPGTTKRSAPKRSPQIEVPFNDYQFEYEPRFDLDGFGQGVSLTSPGRVPSVDRVRDPQRTTARTPDAALSPGLEDLLRTELFTPGEIFPSGPQPIRIDIPQVVTPTLPGNLQPEIPTGLSPIEAPFEQPLELGIDPRGTSRKDSCTCDDGSSGRKKKKKKKRKERDICFRGTYKQNRKGISYHKIEQIPCESAPVSKRETGSALKKRAKAAVVKAVKRKKIPKLGELARDVLGF